MNNELKKPHTFLLFLLISFPSFVAVLISAALPKMAESFQVSSGYVQQLITVFVIGYAFAQLIYSPFANRFGRKVACYFGLGIYIVGSLVCILGALACSLEIIFIGRFITALGSSAGLALTYTIINDYYPPKERRQVVGYVTLAYAIVPSISVMIGGFLTTYFSWKSCFYFSLMYAFLIATVIYLLPETHLYKDKDALKLHRLIGDYAKAFKNLKLIVFSSISGLASTYIYITISESPFIGISEIGLLASIYGLLMLLPYIGQVIGCLLAAHFTHKFSPYAFLKIAFSFLLAGSLFMFFSFLRDWITVPSLLIPLFLIMTGLPIVYSNSSLMALFDYEDRATGSAVMTFLIMLPTVVVLVIRGFITLESPLLMPGAFVILIGLIILLFKAALKRFKEPSL